MRTEQLDIVAAAQVESPAGPASPLYHGRIPAAWPNPPQDYAENVLNLHAHLVRNEMTTYFLRVSGDSMSGAGIYDGDLLIVDRSLEPVSGSIVIAALDGALTVKRLVFRGQRIFLQPENDRYKTVEIPDSNALHIWGVVAYSIHKPV